MHAQSERFFFGRRVMSNKLYFSKQPRDTEVSGQNQNTICGPIEWRDWLKKSRKPVCKRLPLASLTWSQIIMQMEQTWICRKQRAFFHSIDGWLNHESVQKILWAERKVRLSKKKLSFQWKASLDSMEMCAVLLLCQFYCTLIHLV